MPTVRKVQKIESRAELAVTMPVSQRKKRVAAYARVSTDSDEQLSSYEAQVDFYTRYIKGNPEWEFVFVYTDEGISGTNTKKREGFNRMVADALNGKIDLILTKSISRFARNTVDTLTTVRRLKEKGVEVYFEKENIYTLDAKGEVMITIMSSLAQEESRSISENVTWGKRKSMEDGKINMPYKSFLGYEKGEDGLPKIVEAEAKIVRRIYNLFLSGSTVRTIADLLTAENIPTPRGRKQWSVSTIMSILQNEKYKGDALLQKTFTVDFLTKRTKKNNGEVPQYYIQNSHPAIIEPETFELVQQEIERRTPKRHQLHRCSPFTAKIICGNCGGFYGRKVWHSSSDRYRKLVWQCNQKYQQENHCTMPNLTEDEIKAAFMETLNQILRSRERFLSRLEKKLPILEDTTELDQQLEQAKEEHANLLSALRRYMEENTRHIQDQTEYNRRFSEMDRQCQEAEKQIAKIQVKILARQGQKAEILRCIEKVKQCDDSVNVFDSKVWNALVDSVTVNADKMLTFFFRDGTEIPVNLPERK